MKARRKVDQEKELREFIREFFRKTIEPLFRQTMAFRQAMAFVKPRPVRFLCGCFKLETGWVIRIEEREWDKKWHAKASGTDVWYGYHTSKPMKRRPIFDMTIEFDFSLTKTSDAFQNILKLRNRLVVEIAKQYLLFWKELAA